MKLRTLWVGLVICAISLFTSRTAWAIIAVDDPNAYNDANVPYKLAIINTLVGADTFYNAGYYGSRTLIANVEAGHVWNGHETLQNVNIYVNDPNIGWTTRQYDYHATAVGFTMVGLGPYDPNYGYSYSQFGIAPGATLASVAIATYWDPNGSGSFETSTDSFTYGYKKAMSDGVPVEIFGPGTGFTVDIKAKVINSSWGFSGDPAGTSFEAKVIDALAYANGTIVCLAAGNSGDPASGPAAGYNKISVGALDGPASGMKYNVLADFSCKGAGDYVNPDPNGRGRPSATGVRPTVDIVAPGTSLYLAAYLGYTGSDPLPGNASSDANNLYFTSMSGTSFASPIVAGGAALIVDAGYAVFGTDQAVDGRVVKAVLLNSASKIPGWTNNTFLDGNGVRVTLQGLDYNSGAGALDLKSAYNQYLYANGTHDVAGLGGGTVAKIGWDYGQVSAGTPNRYFINELIPKGQMLAATLDWFLNRQYDANTQTATDVSFDEIHLQLWKTDGNTSLLKLVGESVCPYNNVQHMFFEIPEDGYYALSVDWVGQNYDLAGNSPETDVYGLAWSVPEPATVVILAGGAMLTLLRHRRRRLAPPN